MKAIIILVLFFIPVLAYSEPTKIDNWEVDVDENNSIVCAGTTNDSNNSFGQCCYAKQGNCIYVMNIDTACDDGKKYTLLVNYDGKASVLELYCSDIVISKKYFYVFSDFNNVDKIVKKASKIGFAMALDDNLFKVIRFDLTGADKAIRHMRNVADKIILKTEPNSLNEYL